MAIPSAKRHWQRLVPIGLPNGTADPAQNHQRSRASSTFSGHIAGVDPAHPITVDRVLVHKAPCCRARPFAQIPTLATFVEVLDRLLRKGLGAAAKDLMHFGRPASVRPNEAPPEQVRQVVLAWATI